ncbi:response regulator [Aquimarina addita]|uniref:Response regulator n=1 Tax=Aquimarina addita TaxID=870485 RepID=A0ABP6ULZ2_9FLAO
MNKLKRFLLIDDSSATNFFNKTIIEKTNYVDEVLVATNGKEALAYIKKETLPEIIFLDLNMPVMNGWEFLDAYQMLEDSLRNSVIIIMLGASLTKEEEKRLECISQVKGFKEKMLTKDTLHQIISIHFPEVISK